MQHIMEMECSFLALFIFMGLLMPCLALSIFDQVDIYLFDRLIKGKKNFAGSEKNFLMACLRFPGGHLLLTQGAYNLRHHLDDLLNLGTGIPPSQAEPDGASGEVSRNSDGPQNMRSLLTTCGTGRT